MTGITLVTEPQTDGKMRGACGPLHEHALFILDEHGTPIPCPDIERWGDWFSRDKNKQICLTRIRGVTVSTIFLGVAIPAPPESGMRHLFFETRILRGFFGSDSLRAQTIKDARLAHERACAVVTNFSFIPVFIQDALRFLHHGTTYVRFRVARFARAFFSLAQ